MHISRIFHRNFHTSKKWSWVRPANFLRLRLLKTKFITKNKNFMVGNLHLSWSHQPRCWYSLWSVPLFVQSCQTLNGHGFIFTRAKCTQELWLHENVDVSVIRIGGFGCFRQDRMPKKNAEVEWWPMSIQDRVVGRSFFSNTASIIQTELFSINRFCIHKLQPENKFENF